MTDFICHKKDWSRVTEDEVRAILQPLVTNTLPEDLSRFEWFRLKTGDPFAFSVSPVEPSGLYLGVTRDHRTPGITAVLCALADAGFLLHYSGTEQYINPHDAEWWLPTAGGDTDSHEG